MTKTLGRLLRAWAQRPDESFVRNLRLRAQGSPSAALSRRLRAGDTH